MHVHIFWDAQSPAGLQMPVSRKISAVLGVPTTVSENHVRMMGYVTERRQIDAAALLDSIQTYRHRHEIADPILLVVHQDLFKCGSSFVFGLARESTGVAVVSSSRLSNEYYGLPGSDDDLMDRIVKEGAHEIGHLLGLGHCSNRECVMFKPDTLDELDRKKKQLCSACYEQMAAKKDISG
ncbi:MAG: archaemetzincin family Zn-dependent metalloprotease [Methanomicrobiales archaeon]